MRTPLEEGIKLHGFADIFPEQFLTETSGHREAVVAADQRRSSVAFATISPSSSTMFFMCRSNPPRSVPAIILPNGKQDANDQCHTQNKPGDPSRFDDGSPC